MEKVSASNITRITQNFNNLSGPPPSFEMVVEQVRNALIEETTPKKQRKKEKKNGERADRLKEAGENLPEGMKLVPVLYKKSFKDDHKEVRNEFNPKVGPAAYRRLARNWGKELSDQGFCEYAINKMKEGHHPRDKNGNPFNWSLDHMLECQGGGRASLEKKPDPDWPENDPLKPDETFMVNHLGNIDFMPDPVHEHKNVINRCQIHDMEEGEIRWIYMAAIDREEGAPPFYPHMKAKGEPQDGITPKEDLTLASYTAIQSSDRCVTRAMELGGYEANGDTASMEEALKRAKASLIETYKRFKETNDKATAMEDNNTLKTYERRLVRKNNEALFENLKIISQILPPYLSEEDCKIVDDFSSLLGDYMSIEHAIEEQGIKEATIS